MMDCPSFLCPDRINTIITLSSSAPCDPLVYGNQHHYAHNHPAHSHEQTHRLHLPICHVHHQKNALCSDSAHEHDDHTHYLQTPCEAGEACPAEENRRGMLHVPMKHCCVDLPL